MKFPRKQQRFKSGVLYKRRKGLWARLAQGHHDFNERRFGASRPIRGSAFDDLLHYVDDEHRLMLMDKVYRQGLVEAGLSEEEIRMAEGSWSEEDPTSVVAGN